MRQPVQPFDPEPTESTSEFAMLLTARQVADLLQLSVRSVWRLRSAGALPHEIRIGAAVRWRRDEISRWIDKGCPPALASKRSR